MKILTIGNSFSEDATRYLSQIARADGVELEVINVCIGGCSLEMHYRNMLENKKEYMLQVNGENSGFFVTLEEALLSREWDVVTLQQVSHLSFAKDSYYPYIKELTAYIRKCQPKAKLLLHETWAYEDNSWRLNTLAGYDTHKAMLADIKEAYSSVAEAERYDGIIPSGELFDAMLDNGVEKVHRDTFHASWGLGRYALGLLWFRMLTGKSVSENKFNDLDMPAEESDMAIAKACADSFAPIF